MTYKIIFQKWFWGIRTVAEMILGRGLVTAKMISGGLKSMLEKWFQGVTVPDHPRIISEMISRGGEVQPPEGRGDVFGTPFQKHWYLQCFVKTHARNTVNTNEFKDYIFHGNKPQTAKTLLFTAFLRNDFSKKTCFLDHFWRLKPPKTKRGGYPPIPLPHLKF